MFISTIDSKLFCNFVKPIQFPDNWVPTLYTTGFTSTDVFYYVYQNILYMHIFDGNQFNDNTPYVIRTAIICYELKITPTYLVARCSCIAANETQFQHQNIVYDSSDALYLCYVGKNNYATSTYARINNIKYNIPMIFEIERVSETNYTGYHIKDGKMRNFTIKDGILSFGEYYNDIIITQIGKITFVKSEDITAYIPHGNSYYMWVCDTPCVSASNTQGESIPYDITKLTNVEIYNKYIRVTINNKKYVSKQIGELIEEL